MNNSLVSKKIEAIKAEVSRYPNIAIALSGGIDSITLSRIAGLAGNNMEVIHAISPAVPPEASERVRVLSRKFGWNLKEIDAGEFRDERYLANPINRCFYCKESLYTAISAISKKTEAQVFSGTNADDLLEYRPGLEAASKLHVIHPFANLGIDKSLIRIMANELGLSDLANLPASPCLSSRIETGIPIEASTLVLVHRIESLIQKFLDTQTVRCRVRPSSIRIELDPVSLHILLEKENIIIKSNIENEIQKLFGESYMHKEITFSPYITGSAFVQDKNAISRL